MTLRFNGLEYPVDKGGDMIRAIYSDDTLGFIRDHVYAEVSDWGSFTNKGSVKA